MLQWYQISLTPPFLFDKKIALISKAMQTILIGFSLQLKQIISYSETPIENKEKAKSNLFVPNNSLFLLISKAFDRVWHCSWCINKKQ